MTKLYQILKSSSSQHRGILSSSSWICDLCTGLVFDFADAAASLFSDTLLEVNNKQSHAFAENNDSTISGKMLVNICSKLCHLRKQKCNFEQR